MTTAIRVENLGKRYALGVTHAGTLHNAVSRWTRRLRGLSPDGPTSDASGDGPEEFWALDDVSFEVTPGEVVGVIGRNGAGKSTLLKVLSRVTRPTRGRVEIKGRVSSLLEVGTGFHPELTGRENVYLNGTLHGMTKRQVSRKFDEIVDFSGGEKFIDTPVKRYSSGMKVRLGFAVAAHLDPEILIVDEVLAVGDADFQRKCIGKMRDVARDRDRTVLLVSHNMASIASLATHCLYLKDGRSVAYGFADDVIETYSKQCGTGVNLAEPGLFLPPPTADRRPMIVQSLEVFSRGRRTDRMRMGDDLAFRIVLDSRARPDVRSGMIGISIETTIGQRVVSLGSGHSGFRFELAAGVPEVGIRCDAGRIPLNQGQYAIRLNVSSAAKEPIEVHEAIGQLEVSATDVFRSGMLLNGQHGVFWWKSIWDQDDPDRPLAKPFRSDPSQLAGEPR